MYTQSYNSWVTHTIHQSDCTARRKTCIWKFAHCLCPIAFWSCNSFPFSCSTEHSLVNTQCFSYSSKFSLYIASVYFVRCDVDVGCWTETIFFCLYLAASYVSTYNTHKRISVLNVLCISIEAMQLHSMHMKKIWSALPYESDWCMWMASQRKITKSNNKRRQIWCKEDKEKSHWNENKTEQIMVKCKTEAQKIEAKWEKRSNVWMREKECI